MSILIDHKAELCVEDHELNTALHLAASRGHLSSVEQLIANNAQPQHQNKAEETAFTMAAQSGHTEVVRFLISCKADCCPGSTPLHIAARHCESSVVDLLIEGKADIAQPDEDGKFALFDAIAYGNLSAVEALIKHKADIELEQDGYTALVYAAKEWQTQIVEFLIESKANITSPFDLNGFSSLCFAARDGHKEIAEVLIENKADINQGQKRFWMPSYSWTPLLLAAYNGHSEIVELLLAHKADMEVKDPDDNLTALDRALQLPCWSSVSLLLKHGAKATDYAKAKAIEHNKHMAVLEWEAKR